MKSNIDISEGKEYVLPGSGRLFALGRRLGTADATGTGTFADRLSGPHQRPPPLRRYHQRDQRSAQALLEHQGRQSGPAGRTGTTGHADPVRCGGRSP